MTKQIDTVAAFKQLVGENVFEVNYRKDNGKFSGFRKGTVDASSSDAQDSRNQIGDVLYYDETKKGFRVFRLGNMEQLKVNGEIYRFKKFGR